MCQWLEQWEEYCPRSSEFLSWKGFQSPVTHSLLSPGWMLRKGRCQGKTLDFTRDRSKLSGKLYDKSVFDFPLGICNMQYWNLSWIPVITSSPISILQSSKSTYMNLFCLTFWQDSTSFILVFLLSLITFHCFPGLCTSKFLSSFDSRSRQLVTSWNLKRFQSKWSLLSHMLFVFIGCKTYHYT